MSILPFTTPFVFAYFQTTNVEAKVPSVKSPGDVTEKTLNATQVRAQSTTLIQFK